MTATKRRCPPPGPSLDLEFAGRRTANTPHAQPLPSDLWPQRGDPGSAGRVHHLVSRAAGALRCSALRFSAVLWKRMTLRSSARGDTVGMIARPIAASFTRTATAHTVCFLSRYHQTTSRGATDYGDLRLPQSHSLSLPLANRHASRCPATRGKIRVRLPTVVPEQRWRWRAVPILDALKLCSPETVIRC